MKPANATEYFVFMQLAMLLHQLLLVLAPVFLPVLEWQFVWLLLPLEITSARSTASLFRLLIMEVLA
jgi:hypothetical protein